MRHCTIGCMMYKLHTWFPFSSFYRRCYVCYLLVNVVASWEEFGWVGSLLSWQHRLQRRKPEASQNAKEVANRKKQKGWNCTLDLILEGLETLSVSKSKMENRWNEHMIKFEWVESLLAPRAAREAGLEEQKWTDCTRNFIPMQLRSFFIAISACFLTSDILSSDASMLSIWYFLPCNWIWKRNNTKCFIKWYSLLTLPLSSKPKFASLF